MDSDEETSDNEDVAQDVSDDESLSSEPEGVLVANPFFTTSDSDDQHTDGPVREFDTNIPTMHKYLGRLNSISGYSIFDDGESLTLFALHTNTIVSPGFTLPLILDIPSEQECMKKCIAEKCVFAVVFENERRAHIFSYGMIMEVYESHTSEGVMHLKARGRQRCKILRNQEIRYLGGRLVQVTVRALAEPDIKSPIGCSQLLRLKANRPYHREFINPTENCCKCRQYHLSQFPYASWVYDHNEVLYYYKLVTTLLEKFYVKDYIPCDPVPLSFWFLQNFQLSHEERLEILKKNTVLERLKLEYKFLLMDRIICCRVCRQSLAEHSKVFAMSKDGVQSNYCNPGGHVYETVTITEIKNFTLVGIPTKEFSWFPGYEWTILQCQTCRGHIGWKFTSKNLQPTAFYGLARASLDIKIVNPKDEWSDI